MTLITYGCSVRETAKTRRHARRRAAAIERDNLEKIIDAASGTEPEAVAVTEAPARMLRVDRAISAPRLRATGPETDYHRQILAGAAAYVEHRISTKYQKVSNEAGRQIHVVQKKCGRSIPLI